MKIESYTKGDVTVLEPEGKLMLTRDVHQLDDALDALLEKEEKKVILDLHKTAWISSAAISTFLDYRGKFKEAGGALKLANLTREVQEVIALTRLSSTFEIYDGLEAAIQSFKG